MALFVCKVVQEDRLQVVREPFVISDPAGVWAPFGVEVLVRTIVGIFIYHRDLLTVHLYIQQAQTFIPEYDLFTIRRPDRAIIEARFQRNDNSGFLSLLITDMQRILTTGIREIGNGFTICRPCRCAFVNTGSSGKIAQITLLCRQCQNIASELYYSPDTGRREADAAERIKRGINIMRALIRQVRLQADAECSALA